MDPLTTIVTAIVLGATVGLKSAVEQSISDAYAGLKRLILDRYGKTGDIGNAISQVEAEPDSEGQKTMLREKFASGGADRDQEVVDRAVALLNHLEKKQPGITRGLVGQINAAGGKVAVIGGNVNTLNM